jgi:hypothetical protein
MKILQLTSQEIRIIYTPSHERILIGDVFKVVDEKMSLIAQVHEINSIAENTSSNEACLKVLFSINQSLWSNWGGELPSLSASLTKISSDEFLGQFNALNASKPVHVGNLSQFSGIKFAPDINSFKEACVIFSDKNEDKQDFVSLFASELLNHEQKIVFLDFTGEYSDVDTTKIKAGVDFKLPLSAKGIDRLYSKGFDGASAESRAIIEDVFIEVREYAKNCEEGFIPFSNFKSVVDSTYEQSGITQLILLKNRLMQYEQAGIFADNEQEIDSLKNAINNDNLVIVDLSDITPEWQKDFVDNLISLNIEKNNQEFYLVSDVNSVNFDITLLNKLFVKGEKSGIHAILSVNYNTSFMENLLNYAKNLFLFKPAINLPDSFMGIFNYISKLNKKEYIICGEVTKYMSVFANLLQEEMQILQDEEPEYQPSEKKEEYVFYSPYPEEVTVQPPEEIDLDDNFFVEETVSQSDVVDEPQLDDDEFLDMAQEVSGKEDEYVEFEEDFSFGEEEEEPSQQVYENELKEEIAKDVDELYTASKIDEELEIQPSRTKVPVYSVDYEKEKQEFVFDIEEGDIVRHQKYGTGVVKKIISYGNKKLCSIQFDSVGRRLLDPELAILDKV